MSDEAKQFNAAMQRYRAAREAWRQARKDEQEAHDEMVGLMSVLVSQGYKVAIPIRMQMT